MAKYAPTQANWVAVSTTGMGQVRGGKIKWAATNTPAADDFIVMPEGAVVPITVGGYVQAVTPDAYLIVVPV